MAFGEQTGLMITRREIILDLRGNMAARSAAGAMRQRIT